VEGWIPYDANRAYIDKGFVAVYFVFPGGSGTDENGVSRKSGGVYDYRGPNCSRALADVIRFAEGKASARRDNGDNVTLEQLVGYPVLSEAVGVVGISNGGNVSIVTLDEHGDELAGLAYYLGWENPVGDQVITSELANANTVNPYYVARSCTVSGCTVNYDQLALDLSLPIAIPDFADAPGEPVMSSLDAPGTLFFDGDDDGLLDVDEFLVGVVAARLVEGGPLRGLVSTELRVALADQGINADFLATPLETQTFWQARDAGTGDHYRGVMQKLPGLATLVIGSVSDHGMPLLTDHSLAWMQYRGWYAAAPGFLRFNPDASYVRAMPPSSFAETEPNVVLDWDGISAHLLPDSTDETVLPAAAAEMADRVHAQRFDNLTEQLWR
jgi:hypothetical protein